MIPMSKIQVLPEAIANKIAAGEVIERPASVVKELVENSIDAGATQIAVEIRNAGKRLIRVVDNGTGMTKDDAKLAFERHATSKISSAEDLFAIHTLGFRGEALPSIAAVSKLQLVTRTGDSLSGIKIEMDGGKLIAITDAGAPIGTTISVHDLFFNTPARLKFLKSDFTEISQITTIVTHLALAYSSVSFRLLLDGKETFHSAAVTDIRDRVVAVLGKETEKELLKMESEDTGLKLTGYIGKPSLTRKNWFSFLVFVNGRFVVNRPVTNALYDGYHGFLMVGRYPVGILFIQIEPKDVDVNVHPTKREVRFVNEKRVQDLIVTTVKKTLQQTQLIPEMRENTTPHSIPLLTKEREFKGEVLQETGDRRPETITQQTEFKRPDFNQQIQQALQGKQEPLLVKSEVQSPKSEIKTGVKVFSSSKDVTKNRKRISCAAEVDETTVDFIESQRPISDSNFPELFPIAQLDETYIICRSGDDLLIVDQHAAHERVLFDKLLPRMEQTTPNIQHLLIPVNVELSARESALLQEYLNDIQVMGIEIDSLGGNTFTIRAVPQLVEHADYREIVLDLLDTFSNLNNRLPTDQLRYKMAAVMSCRAAIKAGDSQNKSEWMTLIKQLQQTQHPYTCPHGRPTVIRLSKSELEKRFKRTGA